MYILIRWNKDLRLPWQRRRNEQANQWWFAPGTGRYSPSLVSALDKYELFMTHDESELVFGGDYVRFKTET